MNQDVKKKGRVRLKAVGDCEFWVPLKVFLLSADTLIWRGLLPCEVGP